MMTKLHGERLVTGLFKYLFCPIIILFKHILSLCLKICGCKIDTLETLWIFSPLSKLLLKVLNQSTIICFSKT